MPTLSQLTYILTVERTRHFGRAAKECCVSQPSLSMQIQKVEDELGFSIFDRNKKPVMPTERGMRFILQARKVIIEHEKLLHLSREDVSIVSGAFRLGIIPTLMPYILPKFIADFSSSYPSVRLKVDELKTKDIISQLRNDSLDAGILATPLSEDGIRERPLFYEPFYLFANKDHALLHEASIDPNSIHQQDIWLLEDGHCFKNQVTNFCSLKEKAGVYPNVSFEGGNLETLRYLVKESRGFTLVPYLFANNLTQFERDEMIRPFRSPFPTREVSIVFYRDQWKMDIIDALESVIRRSLPKELSSVRDGQQKIIPIL